MSHLIYPGHGVGRATYVTKELGGIKAEFARIDIIGGVTILVPTNRLPASGVREPIGKTEALRIQRALSADVDPPAGEFKIRDWNRRYRDNLQKVAGGRAEDLLDVVLELRARRLSGGLSFGERQMLDSATALLETELEIVLGGAR